jgi:hypothetical protein
MLSCFALRVTILPILALTFIAHPVLCVTTPAGSSASYMKKKPLGVPAHVVTIDMNDRSMAIDVALSRGGLGASEPFKSMVSRTRPVAAITGTFFCTKSLLPIGDIVMGGRQIIGGPIGSCFAFNPSNGISITGARKGSSVDWTGCLTGVRTGPQLISNGQIRISAKEEGFKGQRLLQRHMRAAIGMTARNKLLLVAVKKPVTMSELAKIMRALGAIDAINLDGGSSVALSYGNKVVAQPGRRLTNIIVVSKRRNLPPTPIAADKAITRPTEKSTTKPGQAQAAPALSAPLPNTTLEQYATLPEGIIRRDSFTRQTPSLNLTRLC